MSLPPITINVRYTNESVKAEGGQHERLPSLSPIRTPLPPQNTESTLHQGSVFSLSAHSCFLTSLQTGRILVGRSFESDACGGGGRCGNGRNIIGALGPFSSITNRSLLPAAQRAARKGSTHSNKR
jgi:hypothetical protein